MNKDKIEEIIAASKLNELPFVHEIIARELGIPQQDVLKDRAGSYIITGTTKEGGLHHGE